MLILTRCPGESVMIGDDIIITVLAIKGNNTPRFRGTSEHSRAPREEVYRRIQAEKITNISQARSGNFPLRIERSPKCSSGSDFGYPRLNPRSTGSEETTKFSASAHSVGGPSFQGYVEPSHGGRTVELSAQTRKDLLKW